MAGPAAEGANGDRDSVDDVIERLLSVRGERGEGVASRLLSVCEGGRKGHHTPSLSVRGFVVQFCSARVNGVRWVERFGCSLFWRACVGA